MKYQQKSMLIQIINIITLQFVERKTDYNYELWNHRHRNRNHNYQKKKHKPEPFKIETLETIKENKLQTIPPQLITPPPAYQCQGNSLSAPIPSAPKTEQHNILFNNHPYETPIPIDQPTPYEIPKPASTSSEQQNLIPTSKLLDIQNPPPIDFDQLKLTANKMHNRSHSLDILKNDQPHTNEVTYFDTHSADTYEI